MANNFDMPSTARLRYTGAKTADFHIDCFRFGRFVLREMHAEQPKIYVQTCADKYHAVKWLHFSRYG